MANYLTMRDLGRSFGLSSHRLSRILKELGLRTPEGKPTEFAFKNGLCAPHFASNGENYCYAWDEESVGNLLEFNGYLRNANHEIPFDAPAPVEMAKSGGRETG